MMNDYQVSKRKMLQNSAKKQEMKQLFLENKVRKVASLPKLSTNIRQPV